MSQIQTGQFSPALHLPKRKVKGLLKFFGGAGTPFYHTNVAVEEGTAMKLTATPNLMVPAGPGEGAEVRGLSLQITYDDTQYGQLQNYHFANDTRQRLDGMPIGLLTGQGYAILRNYSGEVVYGNQAYVGPSGVLQASGDPADTIPVVFEGSGNGVANDPASSDPVRIRFDFPLV